MRRLSDYNQHRAICGALRSFWSALLALSLVWLPSVIQFIQRGVFTRAEILELGRTLAVAALIILFNFVQRLKEKERRPRRRRKRID
jgi:hypothetical protein